MGLLSFLFGCESRNPYHKKDGEWHFEKVALRVDDDRDFTPLNRRFARSGKQGFYRSSTVTTTNGESFEGLSDHYAKDKESAYYCDTYRDGQDYFTTQRIRITKIAGADPATFRYLDSGYARDTANVYASGKRFTVHDLNSFELLEHGYVRDRVRGYYMEAEIPGSDGSTFAVVDNHYSKDSAHVYFSNTETNGGQHRGVAVSKGIAGALPASFITLEEGYGADSARVYYEDKDLKDDRASFRVMGFFYAKSSKYVYYMGERIPGADAATFRTSQGPDDPPTASDAAAVYDGGRRVPK